jgi:hypothetical protein
LWGEEIKLEEPVVHYDEIMANEQGVGEWTAKIVRLAHSREHALI